MAMEYSMKIARMIREVLEKECVNYYFDKKNRRIHFLSKSDGKINSIRHCVNLGREGFTIYSFCPVKVDVNDYDKLKNMVIFLALLDAEKDTRKDGFVFDQYSGKIYYRRKVKCGKYQDRKRLRREVEAGILDSFSVFDKYCEGMIQIIFCGMNAVDAIRLCEGEEKERETAETDRKIREEAQAEMKNFRRPRERYAEQSNCEPGTIDRILKTMELGDEEDETINARFRRRKSLEPEEKMQSQDEFGEEEWGETTTMLTKMRFDFKEREEKDLQVVNDMLRAARFEDLKLEDFEGYLCTCQEFDTDGNEKSVSYQYGFDFLEFACELPVDEDGGRRYQLVTEVVSSEETAQQVFDRWKIDYPERQLRSQWVINFSEQEKNAIVVLYWLDEQGDFIEEDRKEGRQMEQHHGLMLEGQDITGRNSYAQIQ